jgi:23S rRNA pseudouridine1911/1915/1917 synthase
MDDLTGAGAERTVVRVPAELAGERIDRALARLLPALSRSEAHRLLRAGRVHSRGQPVARPSQRVAAGDEIAVELAPPPSALAPVSMPLDIRYEDEHLVVLVKPAGLVMHPGAGTPRPTLAAGLRARYGELPGDPARPGLVHRLDRDTTGLLVVARSLPVQRALQAAVGARAVRRTYEAIVWGELRTASGRIEAPIARSRRDRTRMAIARRGGRAAITTYRVVEPLGIASRVLLDLVTGRTHQIRVHMQHLGHPVVGDPVYGGRPSSLVAIPAAERGRARRLLAAIDRQALHARELAFTHPVTGHAMEFSAERPADMAACLTVLRAGRGAGDRPVEDGFAG